ncbi:hypothetical protein HAX54_047742 [Datura stramonium]|uniref:Uncharacterized protein n=1 Tax=Datura stramonium TaxID=4076 RepID=A0ABS8STF1_DATST|nr:hypothetical protein [Datura stramonium]
MPRPTTGSSGRSRKEAEVSRTTDLKKIIAYSSVAYESGDYWQQQHRLYEARIEPSVISNHRHIMSEVEAPKRFFSQPAPLYPSSNALGSSHGGKSQNVVVRRLDAFPFSPRYRPTQKERAQSPGPTCRSANVKRGVARNWRTEVTFGTILPTANMCPVQRERAAQTNLSCYTESPAGHRGPSGKAMIRRGTDHSFFHWGQRMGAVPWVSFGGGERRETRRMIHLDRRAFSAQKLRINGMSVHHPGTTIWPPSFHPIYTPEPPPSGPATTPQNGARELILATAVERNKILRPPNIGDGGTYVTSSRPRCIEEYLCTMFRFTDKEDSVGDGGLRCDTKISYTTIDRQSGITVEKEVELGKPYDRW